MQLKSFRVRKFRNIEDSGEVELFDALTCVVGKNQAGKSALLRALHKFNPHRPAPYDMRREWPRGQRDERHENQVVCEVHFALSPEELATLGEIAGQALSSAAVVVTRDYAGNFAIQFPHDPTLFPEALPPHAVEAICQNLPTPIDPVGEHFRTVALESIQQAKQCVNARRVEELIQIGDRHAAALHEQRTEGKIEPHHTNETQFMAEYKTELKNVHAKLVAARMQQQQAHDYIVSQLPTFIYMDGCKTFRGRAHLKSLHVRRHDMLALSEEDETFLMLLKLGGLDLDTLIKQGESENQDVIHDRQMDLQDAATTLTNGVARYWSQNECRVQFRADDQVFFTEIEETNKHIGMIPLEDQSNGFQWFFSFDLHFMHGSEGTFAGCVLLLDEPGLHLHPGGQQDLLERLDTYAKKNTLIYTTHLPFLVDLREPKRIKVLTQTERGAIVSDDFSATHPDERLTLQAALRMRADQRDLMSKRNLLVEGVHDAWILTALSNLFEREDRAGLPEDVLITVAGGTSAIVPTATLMIGQDLNIVALFNSDAVGKDAEEQLRKQWIPLYQAARAVTVLVGDCGSVAWQEGGDDRRPLPGVLLPGEGAQVACADVEEEGSHD